MFNYLIGWMAILVVAALIVWTWPTSGLIITGAAVMATLGVHLWAAVRR